MPLGRNIKRYFSLKEVLIAVLAIAISVSAGLGVFAYLKKEVVINDNGSIYTFKTMKTTVKEVLEQNGIIVAPEDYISMAQDARLLKMKTNRIDIKRAVPVTIVADGREFTVKTCKDNVSGVLEENGVKPGKLDRLEGAALDDQVTADMTVKVVRVEETIVSEKTAVPFEVVRRKNERLNKGTETVAKEGSEGVREKQYKVVTENGKETLRTLVKDAVVLAPVNRIIEYGTVLNHKTARGDVIRYSKVLDMRATAYTASYKDTGKHPGDPGFGITRSGMRVRKGVIAVDPKVIPLGTKVYVEVAGSTPDYGYAVAADTGGAIKGSLIDLYFDGQGVVDAWGRKRVKVYVLLNE